MFYCMQQCVHVNTRNVSYAWAFWGKTLMVPVAVVALEGTDSLSVLF